MVEVVFGEDLFDFLVKLREGSDEWELEDGVNGSDFVTIVGRACRGRVFGIAG